MRLGLNHVLKHSSPTEWAEKMRARGLTAASFPVNCTAPDHLIDAYQKAAKDYDILIAEVGVWNSPLHPDPKEAQNALLYCQRQLELAEYVKAACCVNVSGAAGPVWFGCYRENYLPDTYRRVVESIQTICDKVNPKHTYYTIENMQWMVPDSPEAYAKLIQDVDRPCFAAHMDIANMVKDPYLYTHMDELIERAFSLVGPYIKSCHLKDCIMEEATSVLIRETACGKGALNVALYAQTIQETDPDLPLLLEHLATDEEYDQALSYVIPLLRENQISF